MPSLGAETLGRRRGARHWAIVLIRLLALPILAAFAPTTTASAATFAYDVAVGTRVDVHEVGSSKASPALFSFAREMSASPAVEARGPPTTPSLNFNATKLDPGSIRFSQSSVNDVGEVASSMRANGWVGEPVDVVRMPDGGLTALDNTRVLAAHEAGIPVQARINEFGDPLPGSRVDSLATPKGGVPSTWGEGVTNRIGNQNAPFRNRRPNGAPFTGWDGS